MNFGTSASQNLTDDPAGTFITISVSEMSVIGTHGFAVLLYNAISSVKFEPGSKSGTPGVDDWGSLIPAYEDIQGSKES